MNESQVALSTPRKWLSTRDPWHSVQWHPAPVSEDKWSFLFLPSAKHPSIPQTSSACGCSSVPNSPQTGPYTPNSVLCHIYMDRQVGGWTWSHRAALFSLTQLCYSSSTPRPGRRGCRCMQLQLPVFESPEKQHLLLQVQTGSKKGADDGKKHGTVRWGLAPAALTWHQVDFSSVVFSQGLLNSKKLRKGAEIIENLCPDVLYSKQWSIGFIVCRVMYSLLSFRPEAGHDFKQQLRTETELEYTY